MTPVSPWMKLSVNFDANQISNQLDYRFTSCDGTADPRHGHQHAQDLQHLTALFLGGAEAGEGGLLRHPCPLLLQRLDSPPRRCVLWAGLQPGPPSVCACLVSLAVIQLHVPGGGGRGLRFL